MPNIVKITTLPSPLDLFIPHSCRGCSRTGKPLCDCCKNYIIKSCSHTNLNPLTHPERQKILGLLPASSFFTIDKRESLLGELIYDLKFNSNRALAQPLAEILHNALPRLDDQIIIVPLPTNTKHVRMRGLDHTYLIAKKLAKLRGVNYLAQKTLIRKHNTVQVGANQTVRKLQAKRAYQLNQRIRINPDATYLLLDDILTTGASIEAAVKKLQQAGAHKIIVVVLAVS